MVTRSIVQELQLTQCDTQFQDFYNKDYIPKILELHALVYTALYNILENLKATWASTPKSPQ